MMSQPQTPSLPAAVAAEKTCLRIPSQPEWIAPTVEYLKERAVLCGACQESRVRKLTLALHEALTNAVVHGNLELSSELKERGDNAFAEALAERAADPHYAERPVEVRIDYDGERCRWAITDQGKGFDVARALARADSPEPDVLLSSGRGILLMRSFLDEVRYESGGRRVVLTMTRASGEEKRQAERRPVQRPVRVAPMRADGTVDWDAAYEAVSQNLSAEGMAILQSRLATSERILIGLDWEGQMVYLPAEVRHCHAKDGDLVEFGCRFQGAAATSMEGSINGNVEKAVGGLLDQLQQNGVPPDERRAHPRAVYTARIHIRKEEGGETSGFGRDLSRGGISFLTSEALSPQDVILSLPQRDQTLLRVAARIVRCNQLMAGIYDVGARFVDVVDP